MKDVSKAVLGDHFSFIYKNEKQLFSVLIPFFYAGLKKNQKCILIIDEIPKKKILSEFKKRKIDIEKFINKDMFVILRSSHTYLKGGFFDMDRTFNMIKESEEQALKEGYSGLRFSGEASFLARNVKGKDKFMEYESRLHSFFQTRKICALCLYDETKLSPEILAESIHCHPELIFYDERHDNMYYAPNMFEVEGSRPFSTGAYEIIKEDILH